MKRKLRSLEEVYRRTRRLDDNPTVNFGEEGELDPLLQDQECPSLSPPREHPSSTNLTSNNRSSPDSTTSSAGSDINATLSSSAEGAVCATQEEIEREVSSIAQAHARRQGPLDLSKFKAHQRWLLT